MAAYKAGVANKYGLSLEALANDRYAGYQQLARLSRLTQLARHLSQNRFYTGAISIADLLLTADLFPLQLHDGLSLPVDLMYYLERVQDTCGLDLRRGLVVDPA
jgi:glutaredoxin 2